MRFAGNDANKDFSDQYSQDYPTNAGNFDNIHVTASQVTLSGWHASSQAANKPYEWLIALDENGQELYRQQITDKNITRNDVQRVYPYIAGANQSGFQITINNPSQIQGHTVRFIHRMTIMEMVTMLMFTLIQYLSSPVHRLWDVKQQLMMRMGK